MTIRTLRRGLTLIEIMVSVTLSLLLILGLVQAFGLLGNTISDGRAKVELASKMRHATNLLQRDLDSVTCFVGPSVDPGAGAGYFEYAEGPDTDIVFDAIVSPSHVGDMDDVLMCTMYSAGTPFRGRGVNGQIVESTMAEVIWWVAWLDTNRNESRDPTDTPILMRRVLLIRPDQVFSAAEQEAFFGRNPVFTANNPTDANNPLRDHTSNSRYFRVRDISARVEYENGQPKMVANSLSDLANRHHRFAHRIADAIGGPSMFPHGLVALPPGRDPAPPLTNPAIIVSSYVPRLLREEDLSTYAADWVVLSDLLAFDIRAFDPLAPIVVPAGGTIPLAPGDPGYLAVANLANTVPVGKGAYVDLRYNPPSPTRLNAAFPTYFSDGMLFPCPNATVSNPPQWPNQIRNFGYYDTWSDAYERDGIDQDGDGKIDLGRDEVDNNANGLIDDPTEHETQPPYPAPLRGVEIRVRAMEVQSRQVRQSSVVGDFVK